MNTLPFFPQVGNRLFADAWLLHDYQVMSHLKNYAMPVLVLEGKQDVLGVETAQSITASFSTARLVLIDRCGHYPWIDNPEPYFSQIESFLPGILQRNSVGYSLIGQQFEFFRQGSMYRRHIKYSYLACVSKAQKKRPG